MQELALQVRDFIAANDQYRQTMAAALGVGVPEAAALSHLYHSGQLTPTMIAERLGITTASVTGLLDRMAASGLLIRNPNPRDRRSILVTLTDDGRRTAQASFALFVEDLELATADAEPAERTCLTRLLQRATAALQHRSADPDRMAAALAAALGTEHRVADDDQESATP